LISRTGNAPFQIDCSQELLKIEKNEIITNRWENKQKSDTLENLDFPDCDIDPNTQVPLILDQIENWLKNNKHNSLPKTLEKLTVSIEPFCSRRVSVLPASWVSKQLEADQFICVQNDSTIVALYKYYHPPQNFNFRDKKHYDQIQTYIRCCLWISRNKVIPRTVNGLQKSLEQLTQTPVHVEARSMVQKLIAKKIITETTEEGSISYNF